MKFKSPPKPAADAIDPRIMIRGIHLDLTPALRAAAVQKAERLLRHEGRLLRVRLDLELDASRAPEARFVAKGHLEIRGPDLIANEASDDAYRALDRLADKLDRMLRERTRERRDRRNNPRADAAWADGLHATG